MSRSRFKIAGILVALSLIFGCFQNCTKSVFSSKDGASVQMNGNGTGYEGKPYVIIDDQNVCNDSDPAKSRIVHADHDSNFYLVRENCQAVSPPLEVPVAVNVPQTGQPQSIQYNGETYYEEGVPFTNGTATIPITPNPVANPAPPPPPQAQPPVNLVECTGQAQSLGLDLQNLVADADVKVTISAVASGGYNARVSVKYLRTIADITGRVLCSAGAEYTKDIPVSGTLSSTVANLSSGFISGGPITDFKLEAVNFQNQNRLQTYLPFEATGASGCGAFYSENINSGTITQSLHSGPTILVSCRFN